MEELEKLLEDDGDSLKDEPTNNNQTSSTQKPVVWCPSCQKQAKEMEEKYTGNFIAVKQKIFFTDNLIQMYQETKKQLEEMTEKCNQADKDKALVQAQLELILSKDQPSFEENENLKAKVTSLENRVEILKEELHGMDESRRMHEESLKILKAEESGAAFELKKKFSQQISELRKDLSEKNEESKRLRRKNTDLLARLERLRTGKRSQKAVPTGGIGKTFNASAFNESIVSTTNGTQEEIFMSSDDSEVLVQNSGDKLVSNSVQSVNKPNNNKLAHIKSSKDLSLESTSTEAATKPNISIPTQPSAGYVSFTTDPSLSQLTDLSSLAKDWKAKTCKRPQLKKQQAIDALCSMVSNFCEKHDLKTHEDIVINKLYDLHHHIITNKRTKAWMKEAVDKLTKSAGKNTPLRHPIPHPVISLNHTSDTVNSSQAEELPSLPVDTSSSYKNTPVHEDGFISVMPDITVAEKSPKKVHKNITKTDTRPVSVVLKKVKSSFNSELVNSVPDISEKKQHDVTTSANLSTSVKSPEVKISDIAKAAREMRANRPRTRSHTSSSGEAHEEGFISEMTVSEKSSNKVNMHNSISKTDIQPVSTDAEVKKIKSPSDSELGNNVPVISGKKQHDVTTPEKSAEVKISEIAKAAREMRANRPRTRSHTSSSGEPDNGLLPSPTRRSKRISHLSNAKNNNKRKRSRDDQNNSPPKPLKRHKSEKVAINDPLPSQEVSATNGRKIAEDPLSADLPLLTGESSKEKKIIKETLSVTLNDVFSSSENDEILTPFRLPLSAPTQESKMSTDEANTEQSIISTLPVLSSEIKKFIDFPPAKHSLSTVFASGVEEVLSIENNSFSNQRLSSTVLDTFTSEMEILEEFEATYNPSLLSNDTPKNVVDIFQEMLSFDRSLSPLPKSPYTSSNEESSMETIVSNSEATALSEVVQTPEDHKSKESIPPSTVLCTALSFETPSKKNDNTTKITEPRNKLLLPELEPAARPRSASIGHINLSRKMSDLKTQDLFKPRRFSCEAPEKAVAVPPLKPPSRLVSLTQVRSPLALMGQGTESGNLSLFPQFRNEKDIPAHWHTTTLNKDISSSDGEDVGNIMHDAPMSSDYDTDNVMKNMTIASPLSKLDTDSDINTDGAKMNITDDNTPETTISGTIHSDSDPDSISLSILSTGLKTSSDSLPQVTMTGPISDAETDMGIDAAVTGPTNDTDGKIGDDGSIQATITHPASVPETNQGYDSNLDTNGELSNSNSFQTKTTGTQSGTNMEITSVAEMPFSTSLTADVGTGPETVQDTDPNPNFKGKDCSSVQATTSNAIPSIISETKLDSTPVLSMPLNATLKSSDSGTDEGSLVIEESDVDSVQTTTNAIPTIAQETNNGATPLVSTPLKTTLKSSDSSTDDGSLVMDVSDDNSEHVSQKFDISKANMSTLFSTSKTIAVAENIKIPTKVTKTVMVKKFKDFKSALMQRSSKQNIVLKIEESFILDTLFSVFKHSNSDFDVFEKCKVGSVSLQDLPAHEQKFLRQINAIHKSKLTDASFLTDQVIPLLTNVIFETNWSSFKSHTDEKLLKIFTPYSRVTEIPGVRSTALCSLVRIFFLLCKMAEVCIPIVTLCRNLLIWGNTINAVHGIIQGMLCWPDVLKIYPELSKAILRSVRRRADFAEAFTQKKKLGAVCTWVDWLDERCGWSTSFYENVKPFEKEGLEYAVEKLNLATFSDCLRDFLDGDESGQFVPTPLFQLDTMLGIYTIEMMAISAKIEKVKLELIDQQFWPLLNEWSRHLHIHGDSEKDMKVSNMTIVAVLETFGYILSARLLRQKHQHPQQTGHTVFHQHFNVICALLTNFSTSIYSDKAPKVVQCATASFLIRTSFCFPSLAHSTLLEWAKATSSQGRASRHRHLSLIVAVSGCQEVHIRKICQWLDCNHASQAGKASLVKLFWGE